MSIVLDSNSKDIVTDILLKNLPSETKIYVFGSRTRATRKQYADLDLALNACKIIDPSVIDKLHIAFENSLLPFKVDIVDLKNIDEKFYKSISNDLTLLLQI